MASLLFGNANCNSYRPPEDDVCHQQNVHRNILTQPFCVIKKNLTSSLSKFALKLLPSKHSISFSRKHTHTPWIHSAYPSCCSMIIHTKTRLAGLPWRDGSVSGWWLRSPAASLPRAGNSDLIRARTPSLIFLPELNRVETKTGIDERVKVLASHARSFSLCFSSQGAWGFLSWVMGSF